MSEKHTVTLSEIAGTYTRVIASDGKKFLSAVVSIDMYGGHWHSFLVETPSTKWRSESITAAIKRYNEEGQ